MVFSLWRGRYSKFLSVGLVNALIDVTIYNISYALWPTRSAPLLAVYNSVAVVCAILNSYWWNRRWTFGDVATGSMRERIHFFVQALINIGVNDVVLIWFTRIFAVYRTLSPVVESNGPKALAMVVSSSLSYVLLRRFIFAKRSVDGTG